jgi:hypothetical protein
MAALRALVLGQDYTFMSPYPGLDHAVSVQSWGYQLRTDDPADLYPHPFCPIEYAERTDLAWQMGGVWQTAERGRSVPYSAFVVRGQPGQERTSRRGRRPVTLRATRRVGR